MKKCDRCLARTSTSVKLIIEEGKNDRIKGSKARRTGRVNMDLCKDCIRELPSLIEIIRNKFMAEADSPEET